MQLSSSPTAKMHVHRPHTMWDNLQDKVSQPAFSGIVFKAVTAFFLLISFAILLFLSAWLYGDGISRAGHTLSEKKLEIIIGNNVLEIQENVIRFPSQRHNGVKDKLDLYLHWPSLSGYKDELKHAFSNVGDDSQLLFVTLEPRTMSYDMSGRLEPIYSVFFDGLGILEENGLVRQSLNASGGFYDEDLYFQADSSYPFVARCVRETTSIGTPYCIRDVHIGKDMTVTYRFHKKQLDQWFELDEAIRNYAKSLIIH